MSSSLINTLLLIILLIHIIFIFLPVLFTLLSVHIQNFPTLNIPTPTFSFLPCTFHVIAILIPCILVSLPFSTLSSSYYFILNPLLFKRRYDSLLTSLHVIATLIRILFMQLSLSSYCSSCYCYLPIAPHATLIRILFM